MPACCLRHLACVLLVVFGAFAQVTSTSTLSGTVTDPTGSTVPGAEVTVANLNTGAIYKAKTNERGEFIVPSLAAARYSVTVSVQGFKQSKVDEVTLDIGVPTEVKITLEVGSQKESVTVQAEGAVLQTQSSTIATTLSGRQLVELPLVSRDGLDLVLFLPGVTTPGRPRTSTVEGLSMGATNITLDGINVEDNLIKSTDGYFTYVRPRIDAIGEVTISTATAGADSSGEGAVQIKFATRSGSNEYHGSLYEYHRNPYFNANYWFNNRDLPADPVTGKAPRNRVLLNQYGARVGGPMSIPGLFNGKNRAFFFVNYEEYRLPEQASRTRTIFNPLTQSGIFQYKTSGGVQQVNLLTLAGLNGQTNTVDPTIGKLLSDIRASTANGGIVAATDPNFQNFSYIAAGGQKRRFPTVRLDFNLNPKNSLEMSYNYQAFSGLVDFLNNTDPAFPGFPNHGSQGSNRFSGVMAWRSTFTSHIVNELRAGLTGGTILFFPEISAGQFGGTIGNQGGFNLGGLSNGGITVAGITGATVSTAPSRRNTPVKQINDNLSWSMGLHNLSYGFSYTQVNSWQLSQTVVPSITFGVDSTDPASALFTSANFPGSSSTDLTNARNIYSVLTGRVTAITANAQLSEDGKTYVYDGVNVQRFRQRENGFYAQDNWRLRPNLTLSLGLRWEIQWPFVPLNNKYAFTPFDQVYGISGAGNLFKPGTQTGTVTQFFPLQPGTQSGNTDFTDFAPSVGIAWTPNWQNGMLRKLLGGGGRTVIRGGYSISYTRESAGFYSGQLGSNPGGFVTATRSLSIGNLVTGKNGDVLPVLFRDTGRLGPPAFSTTPTFPFSGAVTDQANVIDKDLKIPLVQSWSFGIQREVNKNTVVEIRYVGNKQSRAWITPNLNEVNIVENGFLNEFKLAESNLQANIAGGRGNTFKYFGAGTGTAPLPIMLAYFSGLPAAQSGDPTKYTSSQFSNSTFYNSLALNNPTPLTFVSNMASNSAAQRANALNAGLPSNFFVVNPDKLGGAFILTNFGGSNYNAGTVEVRRRLSGGLLFNVNYTLSKSTQDNFVSFRLPAVRMMSNLNVTHGLKMNWIYELPVGRGKTFMKDTNGFLDRVVGGWEIHGTGRVQSGSPVNLGNLRLVGMTRNELQDAMGMRFDNGAKVAYYLPQDIVDNTIRAFNTSATSATGYGSNGAPSGRYIAPASSAGCIETFTGQCGGTRLILFGPHLTRFDISAVKRFTIKERLHAELRGEFLDIFNNINFVIGNTNNNTNSIAASNFSSASFGQVTSAYQDLSTTNDPGGRLIQLVLRVNF
jgi:hypothetical protein